MYIHKNQLSFFMPDKNTKPLQPKNSPAVLLKPDNLRNHPHHKRKRKKHPEIPIAKPE